MPRILKDPRFWIGVGVGTVIGPMVVGKISPTAAKRIPSAS